ncbi:MAG: alpha-2-macroglobulin, partial [Planctomycetes bacterium]|nr:alpha-2-macroglobulin [Planctomycetota bacterium]
RYVVHRQMYYSPLRWTEDNEEDEPGGGWWGGEEERQGTARLNDRGTAEISLPTGVDSDGHDYSWRIEARVTDASSREVAGRTTVHATHGRFLLAARVDRYVYTPGANVTLIVRALDYTGVPQPNLTLSLSLDRVTYEKGRWRDPTYVRLSESTALTGADGRANWTTTLPNEPGQYRLMTTAPSGDRIVQDDASAWIPGRAVGSWADEQEVELIADKPSYQPGETARFTIRGDQATVPILVTKESQDVSYHRVEKPPGAEALEVPITEDDIGDTYVNIAFLRDDRLYRAEKRVKVPALSKQLQIAITPDQPVVRPRQSGGFTIRVTDAAGQPARAQLSLGVIDEAVYGVKPDTTSDPLRFFYRREYSQVITQFSREYSFVGYSGTEQIFLAQRRRPMTLADFKADRPTQPQVRKEFPDAIFWAGNLVTDQTGTAHIDVPYPDSLTTWRLTARAVTTDTRVGGALARTITTKDLIVRVVTPRFLTEGDEAAIPVIVHNYLPGSKSVAVSFKASGVSTTGEPSAERDAPAHAQTMVIDQGGEQRRDWRVAAERVGMAGFVGTAVTDTDSDAVEVTVPVLPFGLKRHAAAAGSIAGPGEHSSELTVPETANPAARTLAVSLAPSLAGPLLGALDFLTSYPYGCTEQTLSSFVPNLVVLRALNELKLAPVERLQALDRQVTEGLRRLYEYQHDEGGWGWWKTDQSSPFMTAYALAGLIEARRAGYKVDGWRLMNGARGLMTLYATYPRAVPDLKVYMLYVLGLAERADALPRELDTGVRFDAKKAVDEAWAARDRMSAYGRALLLLALDGAKDTRGDQLAQEIAGRVSRKGDLAWWASEGDPLLEDFGDTSVEATAFVVKALAGRDPKHALLEPAVRWLMLNRNGGSY